MTVKIAAFGALNAESYEEFERQFAKAASAAGIDYALSCAKPYPNAEAVSAPGRPLRGEALQDETKKQQLFEAVAADAMEIGATAAGIRVMPCMSMIGFHDGVEKALGLPILRLADALVAKYEGVEKLGVIHMRPAKQRIAEMFGSKAVTPDDVHAAMLLAAEEEAKKLGSPAPVEAAMREIVTAWKNDGLSHILFARADAPKAKHGTAGAVGDVEILSYFDILAEAAAREAARMEAA